MKSEPTFWILARASGFTAYVLLTGAVVAGLVLKSRPLGKALKPAAVTDLHRFLSLLGLGALAVHGLTLVADRTVEVPLQALLVPGLAGYRPLWTGVGVVAGELMVLVVASFWLRRFIGTKTWRRLHWLAYVTFAGATVHGIAAGTDTANGWGLAVYLAAVCVVSGATGWRILVPPTSARRSADRKPGVPLPARSQEEAGI